MQDPQIESESPARGNRPSKAWSRVSSVLRALGAILLLAAFALAYLEGLLFNLLFLFTIFMAAITLVARLVGLARSQLELGLLRHPLSRESRPYFLQCLNRWMFWSMTAVTLLLCIVPIQFGAVEYLKIWVLIGASLVTLMLSQVVPPRRIRVLGNILYTLGWVFLAIECARAIVPRTRLSAVTIGPPFRGEWFVMQGGASALVNHHYPIPEQSDALDLVMLKEGRPVHGDSSRLESYAAYGQPLFAPADGRVTRVLNNRPDVAIGQTDVERIVGNHIIIEVGQGKYVLMAHLKKGSVVVSEGDKVRRGQPVAACGNSGNTSEPHLHLQVQNAPVWDAKDLVTFPLILRDIELVRWGRRWRGTFGNLRRNDRVIALEP
jgi:hypothetical protein